MTHPFASVRLLCLTALLLPSALHAQVGHDPATSPYRNVLRGTHLVPSVGRFSGSGGQVGVAPHDGLTGGLQVSFLSDRTVSLLLGVQYGRLERNLIEPTAAPDQQLEGRVRHGTVWVDGAIQFNLTGGKHWRGFAPYAGSAVGLSLTESVPADSNRFDMGTKFTFAPLVGTRVFIGSAYLFGEARFQFWQVKYPPTFGQEPIDAPGTPENPNAVIPTGLLKEWSVTPWLRAGLGLPWNFPF